MTWHDRGRLRRKIRHALRELRDSFTAAERTGLSRESILLVQSYTRRPSDWLVIIAAERLGLLQEPARFIRVPSTSWFSIGGEA